MPQKQSYGSNYSCSLIAIFRLVGFFVLVIGLVPMHLFYRIFKPADPYYVSMKFYGLLLKLMGFKVRSHGAMATTYPIFFVSNHVSYLDILVLGALVPASFVAKAEVASWPLIGPLAKMQNTLFIERRAGRINDQRINLRNHLAKGQNLLLFPEGTSSNGLVVLPFKSSLFSIVEETVCDITVTVQPVSIICTEIDGLPITREWRPYYAWFGDMTLIKHLWNVFKFGHFTVDVVFHPPAPESLISDRKALAAYCQEQVAHGIELGLTGRNKSLANETVKLLPPV